MHDDETMFQKRAVPLQVQLENASIGELEARIAALREEIAACERAIAAKEAQRRAADAVFGSKS
jgi:uncharacterized small protein (DUF1192 family)